MRMLCAPCCDIEHVVERLPRRTRARPVIAQSFVVCVCLCSGASGAGSQTPAPHCTMMMQLLQRCSCRPSDGVIDSQERSRILIVCWLCNCLRGNSRKNGCRHCRMLVAICVTQTHAAFAPKGNRKLRLQLHNHTQSFHSTVMRTF